MRTIKNIFIGVFVTTILTGCLKDFQELNTNNEELTSVDPRNVFTGATENFNNSTRAHLLSKYDGVLQIMQYIVSSSGGREGLYFDPSEANRPSIFTPYYNDYYRTIGLNLRYLINTVIPNNTEKVKYQNLAAIANILEVYEAWLVFDVNGAAPYHQAFMRSTHDIVKPKYDLYQKGIDGEPMYKFFDKKVKENVAVLQSKLKDQHELGNNDYFYKGNIDNWIKFGNTLRIKMAQRVELADTEFYKKTIDDALASAGGIIANNDESCVYNHPNDHNNNTDDIQNLTSQYCASRAFVNFLKAYDDPRLPLLVRRNGFGLKNNNKINDDNAKLLAEYFPNYASKPKFQKISERYFGISANPDSTSTDWSRSAYYTFEYIPKGETATKTFTIRHNSQIESRFYVKNGGAVRYAVTARDKEDAKYDAPQTSISLFTPLITYSETCFMMAEIAHKAGGAKGGKTDLDWFKEGIRASMQQYQTWATNMAVPSAMNTKSDNYNPITEDKIDAYLARPEFQSVTLEKIISQQWINLFMRPEEMWATWKRTGLPTFKEDPVPVDGVAYFEKVTKAGSDLIIPRRGVLPTPNTENIDNFNAAVEKLKKDPAYGAQENHTEGRIWWDKK
ncbi:SusD/RagB family nutrient-binding outer membrane lipoprotein [Capnocytophaga canimorsus]|uniref:SusD/RagB family nutrient-binding outer membrane lipoprotein n=1 Tax=Capnocytophaga canimorsus TaxID=28188 RepID=A0A250G321_9FLAO|nr:SusD/RagB family nutrient-binding outer membrane lipoprotein [Capnocytophaga canimorsus]ATA91621.1 SusD/RagB family nutrient-binding outer membrane lipoprotein [Capnocytophaga canimorsus]